jgi:hypothetical protein
MLLLCGCTTQIPDYTLSTVPTPTETTVPNNETTQVKEYREYTTYPVEHPTDNVSGNLWYEENALVVSYYDTDLQRKVILCSQPSCTHSNRDCTAYLGGGVGTIYVVRGDVAYALIDDSDKTGSISFVSQNLITGERELIWDLTTEKDVVRERFQLSVDGSTAFLYFEQYRLVLQELDYIEEDSRCYGYTIDLSNGEREILLDSEKIVLGNPDWGYADFGGEELFVQACTEQYILISTKEYTFLPMQPDEYLAQNPNGDYNAYLEENGPQGSTEIVSINRATGERAKLCDYTEAMLMDMGAFRDKQMSFVRDNTMCIYDGRTGQVTECFSNENICMHRLADGRILYTLDEGDGTFTHWYYDPYTDEHHQHFQHIYGETRDFFRVYTDKGYRFISKQDWYNKNYYAAF